MGFESVQFFNFRNLRDRELSVGARDVVLIGDNGQGKTNLIEAIYLLCVASSFRESRDAPLFRDPRSELMISGRYLGSEPGTRAISLRFAPGAGKEIRIDGKLLQDRKELFSQVLCICFVQYDMEIVRGAPEERRRFFDQTLALSERSFLDTLRGYKRLLRSKNIALKSRQIELLDAYDQQLAPLGMQIMERRLSLIGEFDLVFSPLFEEISRAAEQVRIHYAPSWEGISSLEEAVKRLGASRARDILFGVSTSGPHRDLFSFSLRGRDFSSFASTGQARLCALILRAAQSLFLSKSTGKKPVLLFDDVLLELDPGRKRSFASHFPPYEQAFFTFLPDEDFLPNRHEGTLFLRVHNGDFELH
jgi:DNA replication and repair protein RecF